jgi:hypothetical protein
MITREEYEAAKTAHDDAQKVINEYATQEEQRRYALAQKHEAEGHTYTDAELVYAATARCGCGAGLAYFKGTSLRGFWDCSATLKGTADKAVQHTDRLPFAFYEVKSEKQPSAQGATTRPK